MAEYKQLVLLLGVCLSLEAVVLNKNISTALALNKLDIKGSYYTDSGVEFITFTPSCAFCVRSDFVTRLPNSDSLVQC